jgi:transposase
VQSVLRQDPFCGTVFVFRSKRADRVKMLVYHGTGLALIWKRLEGTSLKLPAVIDEVMRCSPRNLRRCSKGAIGGRSLTRSRAGTVFSTTSRDLAA